MNVYDVAVVGGGTAGAAVAIGLAQRDLRVALIEPRETSAFRQNQAYDPRVFALSQASALLLQRLGAWSSMAATRVAAYKAMHVWEDREDEALAFDADLIAAAELGWIVEGSVLNAALWQTVARHSRITPYVPAEVAGLEISPGASSARLALGSGETIAAKLIIAADGANSAVRRLANIKVDAQPYGQQAIVAHVTTAMPHQDTAWQRFTPLGPLAFLPLADRYCSIVWSVKDARAAELLRLDDAAFCERLTEAFAARLGRISSCTPRLAFPLRMAHAQIYFSDRIVLIGDAAHTVHPLAGQGLNLGLLDAAALIDVIADADCAKRDIGNQETLQKYAAWRQGDNALAANAFDIIDGAFRSDFAMLPTLRRYSLKLANRSTALKRELALHAAGFGGRVPSLCLR